MPHRTKQVTLAIADWQGACLDDPLREVARLQDDNDSVAGLLLVCFLCVQHCAMPYRACFVPARHRVAPLPSVQG